MKDLVWEAEGIFLSGGGNQEAMESGTPFQDVCTSDLTFDFGNVNGESMSYSSGGRLQAGGSMWPQSLTPSISASSAGSPTSPLKPNSGVSIQGPGAASVSSKDLTDDEDQDIETGPCEQSGGDVLILKKMRRKVSNRESARRSRRRKQAHLAGLELQVDQLRGENGSLYKQLTEASQHFTEAATDNRVLKSDVEALRMKVKLAQDYITRESLNCGLNHLLQSQISANQALNARNVCCASDVTAASGLQATAIPGQIQNFGMSDKESHESSRDCRLSQNALDATTAGVFADQNFW